MSAAPGQNVLIGSLRRSGGTLLVRLLDGHPECSVFPFEHCHTSKKSVYTWQDDWFFRFLSESRKLRACGFKKNFYRRLSRCHGEVDTTAFERDLLALAARAKSPRAFYRPAAAAYFRHFHADSLRPILVNHCPHLCVMPSWQLRRIFGEHRLVVSIRDPRAVFSSLENKRNKRYDESILPWFCSEWQRAAERHPLGGTPAISLRFEDLVSDPESAMRSLAADLGIAFDGILLEPTRLGAPSPANSSFTRGSGIDPSTIDSWKSELGDRPRREIEERLGPLMRRLGYL